MSPSICHQLIPSMLEKPTVKSDLLSKAIQRERCTLRSSLMQHVALLPAGTNHLTWPQLPLPSTSRQNTGCFLRGKIFGPLFIQGTTPDPLAIAVRPRVVLCGVPQLGIFWCRGLSWHLRRFPIQPRTIPFGASWRSPSDRRISCQKCLLVLTFKR